MLPQTRLHTESIMRRDPIRRKNGRRKVLPLLKLRYDENIEHVALSEGRYIYDTGPLSLCGRQGDFPWLEFDKCWCSPFRWDKNVPCHSRGCSMARSHRHPLEQEKSIQKLRSVSVANSCLFRLIWKSVVFFLRIFHTVPYDTSNCRDTARALLKSWSFLGDCLTTALTTSGTTIVPIDV